MVRGGERSAARRRAQAQGRRASPTPTRPPTPLCLMRFLLKAPPPDAAIFFTPGLCGHGRGAGARLGQGFIADSWTACFEACHESIGGFRHGGFRDRDELVEEVARAMTSGFRGMARRTRSMVRRAVLRSAGRLPPCDRTAPQHPSRYGVTTLWAHFWPP